MAHILAKDLRDAVLQAAVLGKLTSKKENDSSIEELEKKLCINQKLSKQQELSYEIPEHWKWIQIGNLAETLDTKSFADGPFGSSLKKEHQINLPEVRIIQLSNIGENGWKNENVKYTSYEHLKTISRCEVQPGDFVISKMMPAGRTIIVPNLGTKIVLGSDAVKFVPNKHLNHNYLLLAMHSNVYIEQVYSEAHGITRVRTSLNKLKTYMLPIPPIEEQQRIIERVEELMAKIDEYEKIEKQLVELKKEFSGDMRDAILQAAMDGRIIDDTNIEKWKEYKLSDLANIYTGNSISESVKKSKYMNVEEGHDFIATKDVGFDHIVAYDNGVKIPFDEPKFRIAYVGASLLCIEGGSAGKKIGIIDREVCFGNKLCSFNPKENILSMFLYYYLQSPQFTNVFKDSITGMIGGVGINKIKNMTMLLPSVKEQQRIVDILDKLLPVCDSLGNYI